VGIYLFIWLYIKKKVLIQVCIFLIIRKIINNQLATMLSLELMVWLSHFPSGKSASCTALTSSRGAPFSVNTLLPMEVICIEGEKSRETEALEKITYTQETLFSLSVWTGLFSFPTLFFIIVTHPHGYLHLGSQGTGELYSYFFPIEISFLYYCKFFLEFCWNHF